MALATRPKPKTHHKKRRAQHHRVSKHYMKPYLPYLPMLMIVGVGILLNSLWSQGGVLGANSDFTATKLLQETNIQRQERQQPGLEINNNLNAAAQAKADDMVKRNYWSHTAPDGRTPWSFITASGYQYQTAGENLAYGFDNASDTVSGWMNSDAHRDNILNDAYSQVGFGIASSPDFMDKGPQTVVVAEYAQPVGAGAPASVQGVNASTPQAITRLGILAGNQASWLVIAVSAVSGAAFALFITRHGLKLQRVWVKGENFVVHHPLLDIAIVFVFTAGWLLTRPGGIIQ